MKKKLLSLLLAGLMLSSGLLTGCSSNTNGDETVAATADTEESARVSMTLTLWAPTSDKTTEEAILAVQDAVNEITQAKFDTSIELHLIPQDEYQAAIDARMDEIAKLKEEEELAAEQKREEAKAAKEANQETETDTTESDTTPTEDETYVNELGITLVKYPEVEPQQMDIFLVQGYENYLNYIEEGLIQQLDTELSGTSKKLKTYIYPTFLTLANQKGTYAIPNNHPVGEYEYLLVNKELVEQYDYDIADLNTLIKCEGFIDDIGYQNLDGVVPLLDWYDASGMVYWSIDGNWSLLGSQITSTVDYNVKCAPKSLISTPVYTNTLLMMKRLDEKGYIGDGTLKDGEKFAVGIVKGDGSVAAQYEDEYYVQIYTKPMSDAEDMFGNMFAVSTYSKSLSRSMEIITYLNTETDLRTVLQYGAEGIHWQIDPDNENTIQVLSNDYQMDINATGNVYMTYPAPGKTLDDWAVGKQQNLDSMVTPYLTFEGYITDENKSLMEDLAKLSAEYKEKIDNMTAAELEENLSQMKKDLKNDATMTAVLDIKDDAIGPVKVYNNYFAETYPG